MFLYILIDFFNFISRGLQHHLKKEWVGRRDLWLAMHYRDYHGRKDSQENVKLLKIKANVAKLLGEHSEYFLCVCVDAFLNPLTLKPAVSLGSCCGFICVLFSAGGSAWDPNDAFHIFSDA